MVAGAGAAVTAVTAVESPASNLAPSEIHWRCPSCGDQGVIHGWRGSVWDLGEHAPYLRKGAEERGEVPAPQVVEAVVASMLELMESGSGQGRERLALGEALGRLGDPRLRKPSEEGYWIRVAYDDFDLRVARFPVTTWEKRVRNGNLC